jgi:hypothetical protein
MFIMSCQTSIYLIVHVWCAVYLYFPNVMNVRSLCLDNEQPVIPECVVEDLPEQQPGEGKCPQTYHVESCLEGG